MEWIPVRLDRTGRELEIEWSDGRVDRTSFHRLRQACPCATCTEKHVAISLRPKNVLQVLAPAEAHPVELLQMEPAGNYGYRIRFSDGHQSGIYTLELLRELGDSAR